MKEFSKTFGGATILALLSCIIWAVHNVIARGIHDHMNPVEITFWRWAIAFIILLPFITKNFRKNFEIMKGNLRLFIWTGFLAHVIYNVMFYMAAHFTSANNLSLLTTTSFIWTIALGAIYKIEVLTKEKVFGAVFAMLGVLIVILKMDIDNLLNFRFNPGDIILIIACFGWGIYSLLIKKKPKDMDQMFLFATNIFFGLIFLIPLYAAEYNVIRETPFTLEKFRVFLAFGIFASVISWACYNNSVQILGPVRTSIIYFLLPVFCAIAGYFIIGEKLYNYHIIGFVLIILGIIISNKSKKKVITEVEY